MIGKARGVESLLHGARNAYLLRPVVQDCESAEADRKLTR